MAKKIDGDILPIDVRHITKMLDSGEDRLSTLDSYRIHTQFQKLVKNIVQFAKENLDPLIFDEAWCEFSSWLVNTCPDSSREFKLFLPWFVFNWKSSESSLVLPSLENEMTIAEYYLAQYKVPFLDQILITKTIPQRLCFYEVKLTTPGKGLTLTNLFSQQEHKVLDAWRSQRLKEGDLILALLCSITIGEWVIVGDSPPIPQNLKNLISESENLNIMPRPVQCPTTIDNFRSEIFELYDDILKAMQLR